MSNEEAVLIGAIFGCVGVAMGIAAWTGRWRSWVHHPVLNWGAVTWVFPLCGGGFALLGLLLLTQPDADGPLAVALVFVAMAMSGVGIVGLMLCTWATPSRFRWTQPEYFWETVEDDG